MVAENMYRTHACVEISKEMVGQSVRVAGWVENIRDHGGILFLDLRDHYGVVQIVLKDEEMLTGINRECTITVSGQVVLRDEETVNPKIKTGYVEVVAEKIKVLGRCTNNLPFEVATSQYYLHLLCRIAHQ